MSKEKYKIFLILIVICVSFFSACESGKGFKGEGAQEQILAEHMGGIVPEEGIPLDDEARIEKWEKEIDILRQEITDYYDSFNDLVSNRQLILMRREILLQATALKKEISNMTDEKLHEKIDEICSQFEMGDISWATIINRAAVYFENYLNLFYDTENDIDDIIFKNKILGELAILGEEYPNMTDVEIKNKFQQLMADFGDGHSYTSIETGKSLDEFYPFYAQSFEDENGEGLWVIKVYREEHIEALNSKILAINDIPIEEIIDRLCGFVSHDNVYHVYARYGAYVSYAEILYAIGVIENISDTLTLKLEDLEGNEKEVIFTYRIPYEERSSDGIEDRASRDLAFYASKPEKASWAVFLEAGQILYVRLTTFSPSDSRLVDPNEHYRTMVQILNDNEVKKLVLDYRGNGGGYPDLDLPWQDLVLELAEEMPLYIITNILSYSAAPRQILYFKNRTNAIIVGQPTGSLLSERNSTQKYYIIPGSNFFLGFSGINDYIFNPEGLEEMLNDTEANPDNTVYPDIHMSIGIRDFINKEDPVLEYIKGLD